MGSQSGNIAIVGSSGGIGSALVEHYNKHVFSDEASDEKTKIFALSRSHADHDAANVINLKIDISDESSINECANSISEYGKLKLVIVASGLLHQGDIKPEKSLKDLNAENMAQLFLINSIGPALLIKHLAPLLDKHTAARFALLSARVGSIEDNRLGGWYGYRASKAALNMLIKTASIELARTHKQLQIVGLHPGTVATELSAPFRKNLAADKVFSPELAAQQLASVLEKLPEQASGKCFAWDGSTIKA